MKTSSTAISFFARFSHLIIADHSKTSNISISFSNNPVVVNDNLEKVDLTTQRIKYRRKKQGEES
ncbi:hypothetical protein SAMN02745220_03484 [Desulfopila aestuarii DSM 18488]|uniref:Uncharacterized protein n=1 Tax=Desulfopila aestuarii DSM 18488 TaxID=1121416 RepID=A0A1M7YD16_9BACT|nr:hypothetical protein SAMN02745220_03484 [Desulfopila aestuarii DSM 18488]